MQNDVDQGLSSAIFAGSVRATERFLSPAGTGSDCGLAYVNLGTSGAEIGGLRRRERYRRRPRIGQRCLAAVHASPDSHHQSRVVYAAGPGHRVRSLIMSEQRVADPLAEAAVAEIQNGMLVGLGTGRTASRGVVALAERVKTEDLKLRCVATSHATETLARFHALPVMDFAAGREGGLPLRRGRRGRRRDEHAQGFGRGDDA